ncbi:MAG: insulinase family protein [Firmicutes bacterium]|nr:insulinase family protein [Bacillota bacterium]MCL1954275.1 insulinase family protein [Bacillota bacterium]
MMIKLMEYDNGLRVVLNQNNNIRSVCVGIWVGVGSAFEDKINNGISHFTEHMLFKGTDKLSAFDVADRLESVGVVVNAFTGKENTCYYFKCVDDYTEHCFELLSHIYFDSAYKKEDLDKERNVIIEEINMVEDSPEDIAYDLISKVNFGEHPLGQTILGSIDNVKRFDGDTIRNFINVHYKSTNVVLSFAGNITHKDVDRLVRKYFLDRVFVGSVQHNTIKPQYRNTAESYFKEFEQSNIIVSFPSIKFNDEQSHALSLLNAILGGGMSSRLFQNIREQAGLAYSVYTTPSAYLDCGVFNVVCNITHTNTNRVLGMLKSELVSFVKNGVSDSEFERAKAQLKSAFVFGQESVQSCMIATGKLMLSANELFDYNKRIQGIEQVTKSQLNKLAQQIFDFNQVSCAYVGKPIEVDLLKVLRE